MSQTNTQDEYHDMPPLLCGECGKPETKGGSTWEEEHPTKELCKCSQNPKVGDKRTIPCHDNDPSKRSAQGIGQGSEDFHCFLVANPDMHAKLVKIFQINPGKGLSTAYIVQHIALNNRFIEKALRIWEQHPCMFFEEYGRISISDEVWYHTFFRPCARDAAPRHPPMDEANRTALRVMMEQGGDAAVKHMMTDQETGRTRSYAEMRSLYG